MCWTHVVVALGPGPLVTIEHCTSEAQAALVTRMLVDSLSEPPGTDEEHEIGPNIYIEPITEGATSYRYDPDCEDLDPWSPA